MDKDSVILKYDQVQLEDAEQDLEQLKESNDSQTEKLAAMQKQLQDMGAEIPDKNKGLHLIKSKKEQVPAELPEQSYDEIYQEAYESLKLRGLDVDDFDYSGLVSEEELNEIISDLNKPLPREEQWVKSDFIVVFIAAVLGSIADIILSNRDNRFTGKGSKFSESLKDLHEKTFKHKGKSAIDFQGKINVGGETVSFGGGHHRVLSRGHDLLRFIDGIKSFKNGDMISIRYKNGKRLLTSTKMVKNGGEFLQLGSIEALVEYAKHMFADFFSPMSLPFPGYSFLFESDNRRIRQLVVDMYKNGFNMKNIATQALSTAIIEFVIRLYFAIKNVKEVKEDIEISEDYSKIDLIKVAFKSSEKMSEMLLAAHVIVTAVNLGKVTIKCIYGDLATGLAQINVTEIISVVRYAIKVTKNVAVRNSDYSKSIYYAKIASDGWNALDMIAQDDEVDVIQNMPDLIIA